MISNSFKHAWDSYKKKLLRGNFVSFVNKPLTGEGRFGKQEICSKGQHVTVTTEHTLGF